MEKTIEFTIPGIKEKMTGVYDGRSNNAVIVGVDTAIGLALANSMDKAGFRIIGIGEMDASPCANLLEYRHTDYASFGAFPDDCNLLLFCHDAATHLKRHAPAMETLCQELAATIPSKKQMTVCVFTPANACECIKKRITEDATLNPHSLRDLAYAQAEMILHAWCAISKGAIQPRVFRYGELYADMPAELPLAGHVNVCLKKVRQKERLVSPGLGNQKRTLTHLNDFAALVTMAVKQDFIPTVTNIPGEVMDIISYMFPLENSPDKEMLMDAAHYDDDLPMGIGDRVLYCPQFLAGKNNSFKYQLTHKFQDWATSRPASTPRLTGFDVTCA